MGLHQFSKLLFVFVMCFSLSACKWGGPKIRGVADLVDIIIPCDADATPFAGGSGTPADPYQICSKDQFINMGNPMYSANHFIMVADIDFEGPAVQYTANIDFYGVLDGDNHTISNVELFNVSIFNYLYGTVKNLTITNANSSTSAGILAGTVDGSATDAIIDKVRIESSTISYTGAKVGALAGYATFADITDSSVIDSTIQGTGANVGALVGLAFDTVSISASYADNVTVQGGNGSVGGLIGSLDNGTLDTSYASNITVTATLGMNTGGLVGLASTSTISSSYVTSGTVQGFDSYVGGAIGYADLSDLYTVDSNADVNGADFTGGLIGGFDGSDPATNAIANCTSGGTVTGADYVGGIAGIIMDGTVNNSQTLLTSAVTGTFYVGSFAGYAGQTPGTVTNIDTNSTFGTVTGTSYVAGFIGMMMGDGGANILFANNSSAVTVSGDGNVGGMFGLARWVDISSSTASGDVIGVGATRSTIGGFGGNLRQALISSSSASGDVEGYLQVGGFAGVLQSSTADDSFATGNVTQSGTNNRTGGFAGYLFIATITDSYATGNVTGYNNTGGFVGEANSANSLSRCYATGNVIGNDYVGGLVGIAPSLSLTESYASGSVTATGDYLGGLIGSTSAATISLSYASGNVTGGGASDQAGGLIGSITGAASNLSDIFATGNVSASTSVGGLIGYIAGSVSGGMNRGYAFATSLSGAALSTYGVGTNASIGFPSSGFFHRDTLPADPTHGDSKSAADVTGAGGAIYLAGIGYTFGVGAWKSQTIAIPYFDWMP